MQWILEKFSAYFTVGTISTPLVSFLTVDWLTGNTAMGVGISACMTALAAIIVTRPKLIAARAAALVSTSNAHDAHLSNVIEHLNQMHAREIKFWQMRMERYEKVEVLMRATKHKAFNAYQASVLWIRDLEEILKENNIEFGEHYRFEPLSEITGDEDERMIAAMFGNTE